MYTLIVAKAKNNVIGRTNDMPWRIKEDLKFFRKKTTGHKIILGRKNYDSIGHVLKNRENIILTRDSNFKIDDGKVYNEVDKLIQDLDVAAQTKEIFVVGGAEIYKLFLDKGVVEKMYITQLDQEVDGDIYFPQIDMSEWKLVEATKSSEGDFTYEFQTWIKESKLKT